MGGWVVLLVLASGFKRKGHHMAMEWSGVFRLHPKPLAYIDLAKAATSLKLETF